MYITRDFVIHENHCRMASLVTKKIIIHANPYIILNHYAVMKHK